MSGHRAVDLPRVIEKAIEAASDLLADSPAVVIAEYPAHLPAVDGDQEALVQVIASLVVRAAWALGSHEIRIRAELLPAGWGAEGAEPGLALLPGFDDGGPRAVVSITRPQPEDEDVWSRLFPTTGDDGQAEGGGETPLGVAACQHLIRAQGGDIVLGGQAGLAPGLHVVLPLRAAPPSDTDVSALRRAVQSHLQTGPEAAGTLLLMVDKQELREVLARDLVSEGYRMVVADSGGEVLPLAREESPDLILLDVLARDPTAFDIATVLKQDRRTRDIPVLFLTSVEDPKAGHRMGTVNFMLRPPGTGALLSAVNTLLRSGLSPSSRVLVVEADDARREVMVLTIQAHGYRVTEARAAEEAVALAEHLTFGMILLNAGLAQDRDYWLVRQLRLLSAEAEILVMADALSDEEGRRAMSRGATGYGETGELPDLLGRARSRDPSD